MARETLKTLRQDVNQLMSSQEEILVLLRSMQQPVVDATTEKVDRTEKVGLMVKTPAVTGTLRERIAKVCIAEYDKAISNRAKYMPQGYEAATPEERTAYGERFKNAKSNSIKALKAVNWGNEKASALALIKEIILHTHKSNFLKGIQRVLNVTINR